MLSFGYDFLLGKVSMHQLIFLKVGAVVPQAISNFFMVMFLGKVKSLLEYF